ncbi:carbohydrate-binding domain-containing protein [Roseomonas sp. BN140053]|uniref:carbohydrate-binding domain-containing protein n=1 Tax=Roseomonas sp. BN140053 TaxID=3391898 RepID=UPI0039EA0917
MASSIDLSGYKLTFDDEFNAFSWNSNANTSMQSQTANGTWSTHYWWGSGERTLSGNGEMQFYSDASVGTNPFSTGDGALHITAAISSDPSATGGLPFTSGMITTEGTFAQTYGYYEMRAKLPEGQGVWPAFWFMAQDHTWPPEIDVLETFGDKPNQLHWASHTGPDNTTTGDWTNVLADLTDSYHTYGLRWTADTLTYYFDGEEVAQIATPADMHKPMYMIVNLAVGSGWGGAPTTTNFTSATMDVDYVRAYSAEASAQAVSMQPVSTPDVVQPTVAAATHAVAAVRGAGPDLYLSSDATVGSDENEQFVIEYGDLRTRTGEAGDDTYLVGDSHASITEAAGGGVDNARTWMDYVLPDNVENLEAATDNSLHLTGNSASNYITGAAGDDWLNGKAGDDVLTGNAGSDVFIIKAGEGYDTITDFAADSGNGHDRVLLNGYGFATTSAVLGALKQVGSSVVLTSDNGETLTFLHAQKAKFSAEHFALTNISSGSPASTAETPEGKPSPHATPNHTVGSGPDKLLLRLSEDDYRGHAQFTVSVDGQQVGGTLTASASHAAGQFEVLEVHGDWAAGEHAVEVRFLNDLWQGTAETDRNLYVEGAIYNETAVARTITGSINPSASFSFTEAASPVTPATTTTVGSGPDKLLLRLSEDVYQGHAQYTVSVDGQQVGGTLTASASHAAGQFEVLEVYGDWAASEHDVEVQFLNDLWQGTAATDRNLYVESAVYNDAGVFGSALGSINPLGHFTITDANDATSSDAGQFGIAFA